MKRQFIILSSNSHYLSSDCYYTGPAVFPFIQAGLFIFSKSGKKIEIWKECVFSIYIICPDKFTF